MNSMSGQKLKGIPYTGTLPAVLTGTKAGYLHRYKVYGNAVDGQECGERTENLFDKDNVLENYFLNNGVPTPFQNLKYVLSDYIPIASSTATISAEVTAISGSGAHWAVYDEDKTFIRGGNAFAAGTFTRKTKVVDTSGAAFIRVDYTLKYLTNCMLNLGSTAPTSYIPYGYKLPLTSGSTPVDIYIGDDTLSTEEYIDSGTGKIYRMVGGTLTPVDPPVPFPQIPATANSTTISWAGQGLTPSQFDSIQEWVDIPTYKRVNGEWVADNSN